MYIFEGKVVFGLYLLLSTSCQIKYANTSRIVAGRSRIVRLKT